MAQSQGGWRRLVLHQWAASRSGVIWDPSSIPGQHGGLRIPGQIKILFISGHSKILFISGHSKILFIPGHSMILFIPSVFLYSHQRSWDGERLGCWYTPVEQLRWRLCGCLREARLLGDDACWGRLVSPISTTVGGWARRSKAAVSGKAASITTRVSGHWARGSSGYTTPGLSLIASPASCIGQVIWGLAGRPEKGLVQGCSREGEERPDPELFTL